MLDNYPMHEKVTQLEKQIKALQTTITELEDRAEEYYQMNEGLLNTITERDKRIKQLETSLQVRINAWRHLKDSITEKNEYIKRLERSAWDALKRDSMKGVKGE